MFFACRVPAATFDKQTPQRFLVLQQPSQDVWPAGLQKKNNGFFLKDALWGGGDTHRSWPGGGGSRPRALVAGEGWGGESLLAVV